jgi:hypothetical protein
MPREPGGPVRAGKGKSIVIQRAVVGPRCFSISSRAFSWNILSIIGAQEAMADCWTGEY